MSEYYAIKLHNSERIKKIQTYTLQSNRRNRAHAYYKNFTYRHIPKMMVQYGYDYKTENQVMQEVQESFKSKCETYYSKTRVNKLGRMDKIRRKEELGFSPKENPLARMVHLLQKKVVNPIFSLSLQNISGCHTALKKNKYVHYSQY